MFARITSFRPRLPATFGILLLTIVSGAGSGPLHAGPVNINTADAPTLARELKGIGLVRAQAIVAHRTKNGPFRTADDLGLVKGIGPRVIEQNRMDIRIGDGRAPAATRPAAPGRPAPATGR